MGPRWAKTGPNRLQDQRICSEDGQDDAKKGQRQKCSKTSGKHRFLQVLRLTRKAKLTPRGAQDGQDGPKLAQDRAKLGQDGQKMAQDTEDELQDAAQDRQDAISEGCFEHLTKTNPVKVR